jgi:hypothetical protein
MPEVQTNPESGETVQQFIEFVMMQAHQAALFLGQAPNPQTGEPVVNLPIARMFIDQLVMIRIKTRGNLNSDEQAVLNNAISSLQMGFVEASNQAGRPKEQGAATPPAAEEAGGGETAPPAGGDEESHKRFTKSYGA